MTRHWLLLLLWLPSPSGHLSLEPTLSLNSQQQSPVRNQSGIDVSIHYFSVEGILLQQHSIIVGGGERVVNTPARLDSYSLGWSFGCDFAKRIIVLRAGSAPINFLNDTPSPIRRLLSRIQEMMMSSIIKRIIPKDLTLLLLLHRVASMKAHVGCTIQQRRVLLYLLPSEPERMIRTKSCRASNLSNKDAPHSIPTYTLRVHYHPRLCLPFRGNWKWDSIIFCLQVNLLLDHLFDLIRRLSNGPLAADLFQ